MLGLRTAIGWMLDWGLGLTKKEVFIAARQLAHRAGRQFNGPDGLPSDFLVALLQTLIFCKKEVKPIIMRTPHPWPNLTSRRLRVRWANADVVSIIFALVEQVVADNNIDVKNNLWNLDETMINMKGGRYKVVARRGQREVNCVRDRHGVGALSSWAHASLLAFAGSGSQAYAPTFIFPGNDILISLCLQNVGSDVAEAGRTWCDSSSV